MKALIKMYRDRQRAKKLTNGYTHWDIHALARELDPKSWAAFDALPEVDVSTGREKNYVWHDELRPSFDMAVKALLAGYQAPWGHLWSDRELKLHVLMREYEKKLAAI